MSRLRYNGLATGSSGSTVGLALGSSLTSGATSVTFSAALTYNNGTAVPTITGSDYIPLSILDTSGNLSEIVYLTAYTTAGTTGTITRGQEGTTGVAQASGNKIVQGPTGADFTGLDESDIAPVAPNDQTGTTYTFVLADGRRMVTASNAAAQAYTVPPNSSVAYPLGTVLTVVQKGAGQVTLTAGAGVTLNSAHGLKTSAQWATVSLTKILTDTWAVSGDTTT